MFPWGNWVLAIEQVGGGRKGAGHGNQGDAMEWRKSVGLAPKFTVYARACLGARGRGA